LDPKISIILPNYNHASYLVARWESILAQTFTDYEIILLDDASTDNSHELLAGFAQNPKVSHYVVNQQNSGSPFKQWRKGLELAKGEFVWIAESDDSAHPELLAELTKLIEPQTVLAYSASEVIDQEGQNMGRNRWADGLDPLRWQGDYKNKGVDEVRSYLAFRNTIPNASAVIVRREELLKLDFPTDFNFCGDWMLWSELLRYGNIAYTSKSLNYFRKHQASTRSAKSLSEEKRRVSEYKAVMRRNLSFLGRLLQIAKYDWILVEMHNKRYGMGKRSVFKVGLPFPLVLRYLYLRVYKRI
jgi:glycosyltransferase involved in cell wall biosynthesis